MQAAIHIAPNFRIQRVATPENYSRKKPSLVPLQDMFLGDDKSAVKMKSDNEVHDAT